MKKIISALIPTAFASGGGGKGGSGSTSSRGGSSRGGSINRRGSGQGTTTVRTAGGR